MTNIPNTPSAGARLERAAGKPPESLNWKTPEASWSSRSTRRRP